MTESSVAQHTFLLIDVITLFPQAIYNKMFSWIVSRINKAIQVSKKLSQYGKNTVIGVLDIYGFEIFDNNRCVSRVRAWSGVRACATPCVP